MCYQLQKYSFCNTCNKNRLMRSPTVKCEPRLAVEQIHGPSGLKTISWLASHRVSAVIEDERASDGRSSFFCEMCLKQG